ncbi:MAG TPA: molybdopterin cofactor-binding domain-containing protein, partial [Candidatus Methylacidiphilales bacterium]|nr:molybdopterin cofactor-binding domain-containing protein [Candidatus Methylacidiphilales bacterium]
MPSWPNPLTVLGTEVPRVDARAKVTGSAKYASDVQPEGWLYGMILTSKWPAANITAIDTSAAKSIPGVKAVIVLGNVPRPIRYYGQEIAGVAATTKQACLDALRAIKVTAEPLPFVVDERDAMKEGAPQVWNSAPNLGKPRQKQEGDLARGFAECAEVVEAELSTPVQMHHPLEAHGNTIHVEADKATVWASTQGIFSVRGPIADRLKMPHGNVQVLCDYMGGGFGAKFGPGVEGLLAMDLSKETGRPVKMILTRLGEGLSVGNRPSSIQKLKMGAAKDGKLIAFEAETVGTSGTGGGGESAGGGSDANVATPYIYRFPNLRTQQQTVAINAGAARAFRAPSHPQGSFGT